MWINRVRKEDGLYAFFMEAAAIEYHVQVKMTDKQYEEQGSKVAHAEEVRSEAAGRAP